MKVLVIALLAMGCGLFASAQTTPSTPITSPATAVGAAKPVSTTSSDNARYQKDSNLIVACQAQLSDFNSKPCDIIFIGGTNTAGWLSTGRTLWDKAYAPRHALNFGVAGDTIQNVLWRMNNMDVSSLKPKVAVILIGGDNLENTAHEIADGIRAIMTITQATFPGVKIILVSSLPNETDPDKVKQVNSIIRGFADNSSGSFFDLYSLLPRVNSTGTNGQAIVTTKGMARDGIHLDSSGYQIWADGMESLLTKELAGQ